MLGSENLPPMVFRRVAKEIRSLVKEPIEGIKIHAQDEKLTDIRADIFGPEDTPYEGGVFRIQLVLGSQFPSQPPKGFFTTQIFHPNVGPSGEICVNTLKRDWSADHKLKHILIVIRCLLIHPNPDSALNEEAGHLLRTDYDAFCSKAQLMTNIHASHRKTTTKAAATTRKFKSPKRLIVINENINVPLSNISSPNTRKRILKKKAKKAKKKAKSRSLRRL